jgi:hypothetical protein
MTPLTWRRESNTGGLFAPTDMELNSPVSGLLNAGRLIGTHTRGDLPNSQSPATLHFSPGSGYWLERFHN